jgi:choline dehydrogenase-like flavoprotein
LTGTTKLKNKNTSTKEKCFFFFFKLFLRFYPRGKVVGGCSSTNAMIYNRGNKWDYDQMGKENPGWSYADILPCKKNQINLRFYFFRKE